MTACEIVCLNDALVCALPAAPSITQLQRQMLCFWLRLCNCRDCFLFGSASLYTQQLVCPVAQSVARKLAAAGLKALASTLPRVPSAHVADINEAASATLFDIVSDSTSRTNNDADSVNEPEEARCGSPCSAWHSCGANSRLSILSPVSRGDGHATSAHTFQRVPISDDISGSSPLLSTPAILVASTPHAVESKRGQHSEQYEVGTDQSLDAIHFLEFFLLRISDRLQSTDLDSTSDSSTTATSNGTSSGDDHDHDHDSEVEIATVVENTTAPSIRSSRVSTRHLPMARFQLRNPKYANMRQRVKSARAKAMAFEADPKWLAQQADAQERIKSLGEKTMQPRWL